MDDAPLHHLAEGLRCFVCGPENPASLGVRFRLAGDHVEATWKAAAAVEGWPGLLHGAAFGALHDEAAAWAMIAVACRTGFTTHADIRFLRPIRVGETVRIRGSVAELGDKEGTFASEITVGEGSVASTARTTFAFLDVASIERVLRQPLSPLLRGWLEASPEERRALVLRLGREVESRTAGGARLK
jgi:uncharacterized protein (TIGR00369 family)